MDKAAAYNAIHRHLSGYRSDPAIDTNDVAIFVAAVRAVMDQTPPLPAGTAPAADPREIAEAELDASIPPGDPNAPLLGGLKSAEGVTTLGVEEKPAT